MKKLLFDIKPIEYKKSVSVQDSVERYNPLLKPYKSKQIGDRPTIVIDNGSYECRAGWSFEESPYLRFRNLVAKPKTTVNKGHCTQDGKGWAEGAIRHPDTTR